MVKSTHDPFDSCTVQLQLCLEGIVTIHAKNVCKVNPSLLWYSDVAEQGIWLLAVSIGLALIGNGSEHGLRRYPQEREV